MRTELFWPALCQRIRRPGAVPIRTTVAVWLLIGLLPGSGCDRGPDRVPVHGHVYYQGEPLSFGTVMFQPEGGGAVARSPIAADGSFQLTTVTSGDGVQPGTCRIRVAAFEQQRPNGSAPGRQEPTLGASAVPKKYNGFGTSGLTVEVSASMELPLAIRLD